MILKFFRSKVKLLLLSCLAASTLASCSLVDDDLEPCPARLQLRFVFNYNLLKADAFASQVKSVYVWTFDKSGRCVWSNSASGDALATPGYVMETPLPEGSYDFVAWCGLNGNNDFNLATYTPASRQDLEITLKTIVEDGKNVSSSHLSPLFHGAVSDVTYIINPQAPSITTATIPLVKDTNDIVVMLQNESGTPLNADDFTVTFNYADSRLAWDNSVIADTPTVAYRPWSQLYGETTLAPLSDSDNSAVRSTLLYEMSSSRLMVNGNAYLDIVRNSDQKTIIHIPLIRYFLLEKGNRYNEFGEQEYLDRRDDYSILFFLDDSQNWYMAAGIYINGWAVVPPQSNPL